MFEEIKSQDEEIKAYLAQQAKQLLNNKFFNVLPGLLENNASAGKVIQLLRNFAHLQFS